MQLMCAVVLFVAVLMSVVAYAVCVRVTSALNNVATALNDGGKALAEAMGGFWESTANPDRSEFIPLDEFVSRRFLDDVEGDMSARELMLESDFQPGPA